MPEPAEQDLRPGNLRENLREAAFLNPADFGSAFASLGLESSEDEPPQLPQALAGLPGLGGEPLPPGGAPWGPFVLLELLGRGGMGAVYRAREPAAARDLAVKIILTVDRNTKRLARFTREGQVSASLRHPGIVRIHGAGEVGGRPYLACELVPQARSLEAAFEGLELPERVELVAAAARALGYAHSRGVVHRDVKPDNVLVDRQSRVRVADFGLATAWGVERLTETGAFLGTPMFMAPEQFSGKTGAVGPATDVWALGVILYLALTGEEPFAGETLVQLGEAIDAADPVRPRRRAPQVPRALEEVCLRALSRDPVERPIDGTALAHLLDAALTGRGLGGGRRPLEVALVFAALSLVVALALVGVPAWRGDRPGQETPLVDVAAPQMRIVIDEPCEGAEVWSDHVVVRGRVAVSGGGPFLIRAGGRRLKVAPGAAFELRIQLPQPGAQTLRIEAVREEEVVRTQRTVLRRAPPAWYDELRGELRPPLPLPAGVTFGEARGEYRNLADDSVLVWVSATRFTMGSTTMTSRPPHPVTLTRGYFLGKYEVTWKQYRRFCVETGHALPEPGFPVDETHPIHRVSWTEAQLYCAWAGLRLPSEAEWELAARGEEGRLYPWGEAQPDSERANMREDDPYPDTNPVTAFPLGAAPCGALNMAGNVWEWVWDWRGHYSERPLVDPLGPDPLAGDSLWVDKKDRGSRPLRVVRGGSYRVLRERAELLQSAWRDGFSGEPRSDTGLRVCRPLEDPPAATWTVRVFALDPSSQHPRRNEAAWRELADGAEPLEAFSGLRALSLPYGEGGPSQLSGVSPAVAAASLPTEGFSTIAEGVVRLPAGRWAFTVFADDGVRVWIDGELRVDRWSWSQGGTLDSVSLRLMTAREVRVRVEHFEATGPAVLSAAFHRD